VRKEVPGIGSDEMVWRDVGIRCRELE